MIETNGDFIPPPEAPVFEPTAEEFKDPLAYINKIRPLAEKSGICKIKPPPDWQPPFAIDVDTFNFVPRVQRLNELEAKSRVRLNFLDHLAKFLELQGSPLRIPCVERKYLDLYTLQKIVTEEGGFELVCKERKWSKVSSRLGYCVGKGVGSVLRTHYEKILYPYDVFRAGATIDTEKLESADKGVQVETKVKVNDNEDVKSESGAGASSHTPEPSPSKEQEITPSKYRYSPDGAAGACDLDSRCRRSRRIAKEDLANAGNMNAELRKLQFYGPGPKAAVAELDAKAEEEETEEGKKPHMKTRDKKHISYLDSYLCHMCGRGDGEECMLLCDACDDAFHTYCLIPPLSDVPKGDWRCPKCVAQAVSKPREAYGFEQARKQYTLQSFGEMADQFKLDYFNRPAHMVPFSTVEKEFWRLVTCLEEDVLVEYGADIHVLEMGSGFPTSRTRDSFPDEEEYINSGWNLNNFPVQDKSILRHITGDISGMKVPWCYVGMCFSSFAWHIEDHWSYSVNYLHWGEPKTWYGVPGSKATLLEECMRKNAPELFDQAPDLLHQLTTTMNPNILMAYGVPIVRCNQCAGEFMVTFPRSYHSGFNQGYNFAEAVNFCPADWLPLGRDCIQHYRSLKRQCVFSHEELVCKMAANPAQLDLHIAAAVYQDMLIMVEEEKQLRKMLLDKGTVEAEREAFELLPDDERQCQICKTTCFLSAVTCSCDHSKVVCAHHVDQLCHCPSAQHCLRYRYTLDELPAMLQRLKVRAESFDNWAYKVKMALEAVQEEKLDLLELRDLATEAEEKHYPDSPLLEALIQAIGDAEKCASVANQLVSVKVRTRNRQAGDTKYIAKLSVDELECFTTQILSLPCRIKEATLVQELLEKVQDFQREAHEALTDELPNSRKLQQLLDLGITLDVDLSELPRLKQILAQALWLDEVRDMLGEVGTVTLEAMRRLLEAGIGLSPHVACEKAMAQLQELLTVSERMEEKARVCLQAKPRYNLTTLQGIIKEAENVPANLPNVTILADAVRKATEWNSKVQAIQACEHYPYLDVLEGVITRGKPIPVAMDILPQLETQVTSAKSWRDRTARTFLKKNSVYSLVEVLSPRTDIGLYKNGKLTRKKLRDAEKDRERNNLPGLDMKSDDEHDPAAIVAAFKTSEQREIDQMRKLRLSNMSKSREAGTDSKFCVCRKGASGFMLQCELCRDWYHGTCVSLPKSANLKSKTSAAAVVAAAREVKFVCPVCLRSRRPRLETILSLLVSLQKLPVRLAEGEALQCLTERAMAWQDRARQALATDELSAALATLSMLSQRATEQAARQKTERIISAELQKAASNPELQTHLASVTQNLHKTDSNSEVDGELTVLAPDVTDIDQSPLSPVISPPTTPTSEDTQSDSDQPSLALGMSSEHAYSSASKSATGTPRKQQRKSMLLPRDGSSNSRGDSRRLQLSNTARDMLEELMLEGELLEVSLDETHHIWRILQACPAPGIPTDRVLCFSEFSLELLKKDRNEDRKRKTDGNREGGHGSDMRPDKTKKKKLKFPTKDGKIKLKDGEKKSKDEKKKLKKELKDKKIKRRKKKEKKPQDDNDDLCSAARCLRPSDDAVSWVQCDGGCDLWFHLLCVGLSGHESTLQDQDYICLLCKQRKGIMPPSAYPGAASQKKPVRPTQKIPAPSTQKLPATPSLKMAGGPHTKVATNRKPARISTHLMPQQIGSSPSTTALPLYKAPSIPGEGIMNATTGKSKLSTSLMSSSDEIASSLLLESAHDIDLTTEPSSQFDDVEILEHEPEPSSTKGVVSVEPIEQDTSLMSATAMVSENLDAPPIPSDIDSVDSLVVSDVAEINTVTEDIIQQPEPIVVDESISDSEDVPLEEMTVVPEPPAQLNNTSTSLESMSVEPVSLPPLEPDEQSSSAEPMIVSAPSDSGRPESAVEKTLPSEEATLTEIAMEAIESENVIDKKVDDDKL